MKPLHDLEAERRRILAEMQVLAEKVARVVAGDIDSLTQGVERLVALRRASHEETNQLLHEALIIEAATQLEQELHRPSIEWMWNPRQGGTANEPDLQGRAYGRVVVSVEATAAQVPLDGRIRHTLRKLSGFEGKTIYCVRTVQVERRASTKVGKAGYDIEVRLISGPSDGDRAPWSSPPESAEITDEGIACRPSRGVTTAGGASGGAGCLVRPPARPCPQATPRCPGPVEGPDLLGRERTIR